ncbi:hypothetical protein HOLDEFILI_02057 [Holdemania filiformis DSM 12042]|uniref:Uncharacterized protein n=1 Tax=Holdemania filiformis DSM 12042 TaxID=545696 RepID=B9Y8B0_9FIRM|nr:hypothetical protein HOLDEFILI_02057 [Holdemania filiformis DSM 12042]
MVIFTYISFFVSKEKIPVFIKTKIYRTQKLRIYRLFLDFLKLSFLYDVFLLFSVCQPLNYF